MNEIAVIKQLPIIAEQIKEIGKALEKRMDDLQLEKLVCNEESRKSIKNLRTDLGKELTQFEEQRKNIKNQIEEPYKMFEETYNQEIKSKYENAKKILDTKINEVELGIKNNIQNMLVEYFNEYRQSKNIDEKVISYEDLNIAIKLDYITEKGMLAKKAKDEVASYLDKVAQDIETINSMDTKEEVMVEYIKHKNLSFAIKEVNDRHVLLEQVKRQQEMAKEAQEQEIKSVEKVEEVLQAPIEEVPEGQITIDEFGDEVKNGGNTEPQYTTTFVVTGTKSQLLQIRDFLRNGGFKYDCK